MKLACGWLYALRGYGYPPSWNDTLLAIAEARNMGFDAFEMEAIFEDNLHSLYGRRHELRRHIDDHGLRLVNFVPMLPDVVSLDPQRRERALDLFARGAELGATLGTSLLMCDSYDPPLEFIGEAPGTDPIHYGKSFRIRVDPEFSWERVWANMIDAMGRVVDIAAGVGLPLAMELRMRETVSNTDAFLRLYDAVGRKNFGAVFDVAHLHAQGELIPLSVEKLGRCIFLVHASDNDGTTNAHRPLGQGTIDWVATYAALAKHGFDGYTVLDIADSPDLAGAYRAGRQFFDALGLR